VAGDRLFRISFVAGGRTRVRRPAGRRTRCLSPLGGRARFGGAQTWWLLGVTFVGVSSMMGSVNYMTTIINMRAPGMTLFRMPLTIWAMFITAILQAFALPVLTAAGFMLLFDRPDLGHARSSSRRAGRQQCRADVGGGQPLLWQHLFWFYSHPAVYIMLLPAMGMVSDMLACMCRKAGLRLQADGVFDGGDCRAGLYRVGPPHVYLSGMNPRWA
jgi:cytochrome c oxidase subunit I